MWTFSHHFQSFWHMGISFFNFHFHPFYFMSNPTTFSLSLSLTSFDFKGNEFFLCLFITSDISNCAILRPFCFFFFFLLYFPIFHSHVQLWWHIEQIDSVSCRTNLFFLLLLKWWWLCITLESERVFFSFPKRVRNTWTWTDSKSQGLLKQWCQSKGK